MVLQKPLQLKVLLELSLDFKGELMAKDVEKEKKRKVKNATTS